ncbi:uncharacterized protein LOC133909918 [Phragmites australis]|uniref:uncharacterized protein LOC133909918 n=1 Tax=Phragmites australis TaxID=29695 RepID=UPI002D78A159|nr:uncharacterized protein LOC133909918 [Phragmites australis]
MCESISLQVASNKDVHQEENKTTEMNTGDLVDVPSHPPSETPVYYDDDYRYFYDNDENVQEEGVDGLLEDNAPPPEQQETEAVAPTPTVSLAKLSELRRKLAGVNTAGAVVAGLGLLGGAVGAYFLWPVAAGGAAAAAATMKAPGAAGFFISRAAFLANPQLYFQLLRTAGAAAAAAAFAV